MIDTIAHMLRFVFPTLLVALFVGSSLQLSWRAIGYLLLVFGMGAFIVGTSTLV